MYKINNCNNVNDFRNLAKKNYRRQFFIILMALRMMRLRTKEIPSLSTNVI